MTLTNTATQKTPPQPTQKLIITKRASKERGYTHIDWLKSYHSFSFGEYHDSNHMGFGNLRVINDDVIAPSQGFGTHGHRDMEIITIVLTGELAHKDSIGNGTSILPYDVQRMSAGTGIEHSEFNASDYEDTRLLQIWVFPEARGLKPSYEQTNIAAEDMKNKLCLIAARNDGQKRGAITIHQDLDLYRTQIDADKTVSFDVKMGRKVWIQIATGTLTIEGHELHEGDALAIVYPPVSQSVSGGQEEFGSVAINLQAKSASDVLIFDQKA